MNIKEQPEYQDMMKQLKNFHNKEVAYYECDIKHFLRSMIQKWLNEHGIEAYIRTTQIRFVKGANFLHYPNNDLISGKLVQIHNGKQSINKSRWLNKISVIMHWSHGELISRVKSVARTDLKFLEPTPGDFRNFVHELFSLLVYKDKNE